MSDFASAYRKGHSCETKLLKLTEDWSACRDRKELVAVVSMDLSKAFDTIPHPLLIAKLKAYGLSNSVCALFADLTERPDTKGQSWRFFLEMAGSHQRTYECCAA